ncbi:AMP-binding enzyme [Fusarium tjaetaba]|uniref:AMP-binding enzyme n=1 Tax=Fusarium tjaetaba TaxID=1567544 RepID=A0A8H5S2M4_9HYPO|nr:AMP-binding enzyme [Fusarium tjaetaba]KAF5643027.1 AMP-binding enzyme [Fusarium tjaetaba]
MSIYKSNIQVEIPRNLSLTELLHSSARSPPVPDSHIVFEDDLQGRQLTLGELRKSAGAIAFALQEYYQPKDQTRWTVILPNCVALIEAAHAILWLGGVFCPVNHQLPVQDFAHALSLTQSEYIIAYGPLVAKVKEAIGLAKRKHPGFQTPHILVALAPKYSSSYRDLYENIRYDKILPVPHYNNTENRLASIHLSSGTTGLPKGVKISHLNYIANVHQLFAHDPERWTMEESVVAITPFVHLANGTVPFFLGPWTGIKHIIMSSPEKFWETTQRARPTTIQLVPPIARDLFLHERDKTYDLSSVKRVSPSIGNATAEEVEKYFGPGKWALLNMYGMTEAACWITATRTTDPVAPDEIGTLLPGIEARLITEDREDTPTGGPGELWLRGLNITKGYLDNESANQQAFPEGDWFNTGDVVSISSQGTFKLVGRTKELIKYNGFQVSPSELEQYISAHPAAAYCAVSYTLDPHNNELPTAYIVLKDGESDEATKLAQLREIHELVDSQVAGYKKLRGGVWEVSKIARNATAKIIRRELHSHNTGLVSRLEYGRAAGSKL